MVPESGVSTGKRCRRDSLMEREVDADLPAAPPFGAATTNSSEVSLARQIFKPRPESLHLSRSFTSTSSSTASTISASTVTTTSTSSSSSPPQILRQVQAAFKRHRPLGRIQSNSIKPRRMLVPQTQVKGSTLNAGTAPDMKMTPNEISPILEYCESESNRSLSLVGENPEDASITPPSEWGSTVNTVEQSLKQFQTQKDQPRPSSYVRNSDTVASSVQNENVSVVEGQKKVHFAIGNNAQSHDMECDVNNQVRSQDQKHQILHLQTVEVDGHLRTGGGISSSLAKRTIAASDQLHQYRSFLHNDLSNATTQSSVVGSSCMTTTLINSISAPVLNSTTYRSNLLDICCSEVGTAPLETSMVNSEPKHNQDILLPAVSLGKNESQGLVNHEPIRDQPASCPAETQKEAKESPLSEEQRLKVPKVSDSAREPSFLDDKSTKENIAAVKSQVSSLEAKVDRVQSQVSSSEAKMENSKSERQQKPGSSKTAPSRKKNNDPDLFFKVNGKLYQRLGKIGSGGSSEVHKVISSDCTIYALKKIKLKGRDYATAYGFCQEIEYLNKLKGKNNIIQLIDYEVTDKALLREVMNGCLINKDGRVREDGYIYMVLEYGEIDLANMLSQKWKELGCSSSTLDENWLRFYWQQILLAVNTIHEERIVHSDLKPANFLLVRGSLKLIDFGIAKAIMNDTTNIQRDSQVGTLSYMSPEAFMCNETDADGNTIKCGRPSDIWSLGCILYQMVYGRTPFSDHKTFWSKFKVITDPNHEITYEPVSNAWLIDLMKKCLAWNRNDRWRIPQLLKHPFLVPPCSPQIPADEEEGYKLLQLIAKLSGKNTKAVMLCSQIQKLLEDPKSLVLPQASSTDEQCRLLSDMSNLCQLLREQLLTQK